MEKQSTTTLTVATTINAPLTKVWEYWNSPEHIIKWNSPSGDWHTPSAANDLQVGGKFAYRMEAKDGSMGFDFEAVYNLVREQEYIEYTIADNRKVKITFREEGDQTTITESFETENINPIEMQQAGWQAILDNFKAYTERN